jgi:hypothetical protein
MLRVGFSEFDITPPVGKLIPGGFTPCYTTEPARGKLLVTAAAFEVDGNPLILVSADTLSIQISTCDRIRNRISEATGVPFDRILVGATHTHTGGQTDYQLWLCPPDLEVASLTEEGIVSAAIDAYGKLSGASIGTGIGEERRYSFCRDIHLTDGSIKMNPNRAHRELMVAPVDTPDYSVNVMRIDSAEGDVRGFIVNYANHPDCHAKNKKSFSADFPGALRRGLKRVYGEGIFVLFFNGTCGDVNCIDWLGTTSDSYYGGTKNAPEAIGAGLTSTVVEINADIKADNSAPDIAAISKSIVLARRYKTEADYAWAQEIAKDMDSHNAMDRAFATEYLEDDGDVSPEIPFEIHTIRLGDWAIVGLPSEIFTDIGRRIKTASPFKNTLVFELANGTHGYISTKILQESTAYEAKVSKYNACTAKDSADRIVEAVLCQLEELKNV